MQVYGFIPMPENKLVIVAEVPHVGESGEIKLVLLSEGELEEKLEAARAEGRESILTKLSDELAADLRAAQ